MSTRAFAIALASTLVVVAVAGAYIFMGDNETLPGEPFTVTDMRGRQVEVPGDIDRIIALGACSLRMLSYFDSIDKVVAVDGQEKPDSSMFQGRYFNSSTYRIAFPELRDLPSIGGSSPINAEAIIAQNPGIVFSSSTDVGELDGMQATLSIPVVAVNADLEMDSEQFYTQITMVGKVLGEEARAQELVEGLKAITEDLANRAANVTTERTAYAAGMFFYGGGGLYKTTGDYLPFNYAGVKNVMPANPAGTKQPYNTEIEQILLRNPEFVFIDSITEGDCREEYKDKIASLDTVDAFANHSVYTTLVYKSYGTNWENQVINMYYVGSTVYPDQFQDISIQGKAEEIWKLFFQKDLSYTAVATMQNGPGLGAAGWWT